MILLPGSNLESRSKSMSKSKRQGISPNSMPVTPRLRAVTPHRTLEESAREVLRGGLSNQTEYRRVFGL
jgi:hypothetical protein